MLKGLKRSYVPEFVYGGIDGTITTFAVVAGARGAALGALVILILGMANLLADGFSMAVANYFAVKSEHELLGSRRVPKTLQTGYKHPMKAALVTYGSFILLGLVPLLPFIFAAITGGNFTNSFIPSMIFTAIGLSIVGAVKGVVVGKHWLRSAFETLIIGGIASALAYGVGHGVEQLTSKL